MFRLGKKQKVTKETKKRQAEPRNACLTRSVFPLWYHAWGTKKQKRPKGRRQTQAVPRSATPMKKRRDVVQVSFIIQIYHGEIII